MPPQLPSWSCSIASLLLVGNLPVSGPRQRIPIANADESVDLGDVVTRLNYLFLNSPGALSGTCEATAPTGPLSCVIPDCL